MNEPIVKREIRARAAPTFTGAWLWAAWGGLAAMVAAAAVIMFVESMHGQWLAVAIGAVVFWYILGERKQVHDDQLYIETIEEPEPLPQPASQPAAKVQPWIVRPTAAGQHIQHGTINLTLKEWQTLAKTFLDNGKLTRQVVASSGVFENVTEKYPAIQKEFNRMGLFDGNGLLTTEGREFWKDFITPAPLRQNGAVAGVQPTTTDDDGRGGA